MAKKKEIEEKNYRPYVILGFSLIIIAIVAIYIYRVIDVKNQEKLQSSYLLTSGSVNLEIKNLEEIDQILIDAPNEYFILISYTNDQKTYEFEKSLKNIIDKYALSDRFYYLDVTDILKENDYLARINNAFNTDDIKNVPVILYYQNGVLVTNNILSSSKNSIINAKDFEKLLNKNDYEAQ